MNIPHKKMEEAFDRFYREARQALGDGHISKAVFRHGAMIGVATCYIAATGPLGERKTQQMFRDTESIAEALGAQCGGEVVE